MNVFVMVDIEGISGIYSKEQVTPGGSRFNEGRRFMTDEINACVSGLTAAGVEKIYVRDCHGGSYTLDWENASNDVDGYICGIHSDVRFAGIDEFDAVILRGYHAMAGTRGAVLEHTFNSTSIQNVYLNDSNATLAFAPAERGGIFEFVHENEKSSKKGLYCVLKLFWISPQMPSLNQNHASPFDTHPRK